MYNVDAIKKTKSAKLLPPPPPQKTKIYKNPTPPPLKKTTATVFCGQYLCFLLGALSSKMTETSYNDSAFL